jgi:transposase
MEVKFECCCGLDVHKASVMACCIWQEEGQLKKEKRKFGTMTDDLQALVAWLSQRGVTHVAMESTGSYWKPVWNILEEAEPGFGLILVNPQHIKAFNRDKTDPKDSEWIADLLRHGLLKSSFVPGRRQRELRELTRYRTSLKQQRTAEVNRLQKVLEGANIKLASVASKIMGKSSRDMLAALLEGETKPETIAELARGRLREKIPELRRALVGSFGLHQHYLIAKLLAHIDYLDETIADLDREIAQQLTPAEQETVLRLDPIPGVGTGVGEAVVAELGTNVDRFPSFEQCASWVALCPGNRKSAGKRGSGKTRKGNKHLRAILVEAAQAASMRSGSYLQAQFSRLTRRLGRKKAIIALARRILEVIYHMLKTPASAFQEKGAHYMHAEHKERAIRQHLRRLHELGYQITPLADSA